MDQKIKGYLFDISSFNDESFSRLLGSVKEYRKEKIDKLSLKQSKYLSLAVELLIKKACEDFGIDYLNEEIEFNENGKPSFKNSSYFFNTSHSGNYALCVISDVEVGCDIEEIKEYKQKIAERCLTPKENKYLDIAPNKDELFYRFWTLKESFMKCIGKGFAKPMQSFELDNKDENVVISGDDNYSFIEQKYNNYCISVCLKTKEKEKYNLVTSLIQYN
jgi:4'-phosphopantetheinyl transferase